MGLLSNLKILVLSENRFSGKFPSLVFSLPNLKVLQLQRNSFDHTHLKNSIPIHTNLAILDFDNDTNRFRVDRFQDMYHKNDTKTVDTRFEENKDDE